MVTDPPISVISVRRCWRGPRARTWAWAWAGRCAALVLVSVAVCVFAATADAQKTPQNPAKAPGKTMAKTSAKPSLKPPRKPAPEAKQKQPTELLFRAVELNDMIAVKASIEAGADLFAENEASMTAADA